MGSTHPLIPRLESELAKVQTRAAAILDGAETDKRDLDTDELAELDVLHTRKTNLEDQIKRAATDWHIDPSVTDRLRVIADSADREPVHYRTAGDLLYDVLHQGDPKAKARYEAAIKRAAEHMGTDSANTTPTAGDLGGLVIAPNVGPVVDPNPSGMPFAAAVGLTPLPAFAFNIPSIVDPDLDTGVAEQTAEKAELVSKKFDVTSTPVTPKTVGGYLNVSQQLLSLQAGSLGVILAQLNKRLSRAIEREMLAAISGSTLDVALESDADAAATLAAIYEAVEAVFNATGDMPEWLAMGPAGFRQLGSLVDAAGRPLFPYLGAANAMGTSTAMGFTSPVAGLRPVVTWGIDDNTMYVGNGDGVAGWIYRYPVLEAVEPSVLGRQVAVAASIATHNRIANSVAVIADATP